MCMQDVRIGRNASPGQQLSQTHASGDNLVYLKANPRRYSLHVVVTTTIAADTFTGICYARINGKVFPLMPLASENNGGIATIQEAGQILLGDIWVSIPWATNDVVVSVAETEILVPDEEI